MELNLWFEHGLGDCANFAHILELYRRRGYRLNLHFADDKAIVFAPLEPNRVAVDHPGLVFHLYPETEYPTLETAETADQYWFRNKSGGNVTGPPLPEIGDREQLWSELCSVKLDLTSYIGDEQRRPVEEFLRDLPKPIVLIHSMGHTSTFYKDIFPESSVELYRQLLDRIDGTLVLLDWEDRVARLANWRVRHLTDDWRWIDLPTLIALMEQSDLLIGIDSGPLHLARMTDIPVLGVFPSLEQHPARVSLPSNRTVNVIPRDSHECNRKVRILYNIVESPSTDDVDTSFIADVAARMLKGPRYLGRDMLGADLQLQQFVLEWMSAAPNSLTKYNDRHRGFDVLLREIRARFTNPLIVETGCVRSGDDWSAGYSTYLMGAFTHRLGGRVVSIDIDERNCEFARQATQEMNTVTVINQDSVAFLRGFGQLIDVFMMDCMDTSTSGYEEHALQEAQEAFRWLHDRSIVLIDGTLYQKRSFTGAGALVAPWLLERGWRILHSGYQTILVRDPIKEASMKFSRTADRASNIRH